jgi:hypothetical protein
MEGRKPGTSKEQYAGALQGTNTVHCTLMLMLNIKKSELGSL